MRNRFWICWLGASALDIGFVDPGPMEPGHRPLDRGAWAHGAWIFDILHFLRPCENIGFCFRERNCWVVAGSGLCAFVENSEFLTSSLLGWCEFLGFLGMPAFLA